MLLLIDLNLNRQNFSEILMMTFARFSHKVWNITWGKNYCIATKLCKLHTNSEHQK